VEAKAKIKGEEAKAKIEARQKSLSQRSKSIQNKTVSMTFRPSWNPQKFLSNANSC